MKFLSTPVLTICDECGRNVPVAPGTYSASVAHLCPYTGLAVICGGNGKRRTRGYIVPVAQCVAEQHTVWQTDEMWDLREADPW